MPLGAMREWSPSLLGAVKLCLEAARPTLLAWGDAAVLFYNDAALPLLGDSRADAFGRTAVDVGSEIWEVIGPAVEEVLTAGQPKLLADQLLLVERDGTIEERYFQFLVSPLLDSGAPAGALCTVSETTTEVQARRRAATLSQLAERMTAARDEDQVWAAALAALERNPADLPFALLYKTDAPESGATLAGAIGIPADGARAPRRVGAGTQDGPWPFEQVGRTLEAEHWGGALVLPVAAADELFGYIVAGLSQRQPLDDAYRDFCAALAGRVAAGVAIARALETSAAKSQALEHVRERLERRCFELSRLIEQAPIPIVVLHGPEYFVESANPAASAVVQGRELVGKPLLEALPELGDQGFGARLQKVRETGEPDVGREVRVRLERDGQLEKAYFTFISSPLADHGGSSDAIIVIASDVSEQVRTRAALLASEARYREIFENVDVSIWEEDYSEVIPLLEELHSGGVTDLRGHLEQHPEFLARALRAVVVSDVNEATLRMFGGRDKQDLLASLELVILPETMPAFVEKLVAITQQRPILRADTLVRTLAGDRRDVMMTIALPDAVARPAKVLITLTDITERKAMEQALREADRHKDEFLATLAHELRSPLAPLRSCIDLLRTTADKTVSPHVLDILERQVAHLARLADDLFESSRIRSGTFDLRREPVSVATLVRNAVEASEIAIRAAGHTLDMRLPDEPLWLDVDPTRLAQVLANLLNNAARYTPYGGRITLTVKRDGDVLAICVKDTGIGIPREALPRLFTMFSRIGDQDEAGAHGLGIGLALARQLVEAHGGRIEARSDGTGKGSEFIVTLPIAPGAEGQAVEEPLPEQISQLRILVVDDDLDAASSLQMLLEANGADVRRVDSGPKALAAFGRFRPDVVLLDIGMPGMSGYEVARRLRAEFPEDRTLLVALTGWGREEDVRRAHDAGFDHHLVKPVDLGRLRALLSHVEHFEPPGEALPR